MNKVCSFCGKIIEDGYSIDGLDAVICPDCARLAARIVENNKIVTSTEVKDVPKPKEIVEHLNKYVIGQDALKEKIAVAVYNHYKRINQQTDDDVEIEKSNILVCGPTGSGKTLIAKSVAKLLDVPFAIADSTVITQAGYVGEDIESILTKLLQAADYDVAKAERGIVFLDEIDKIARKGGNPSITRDVSGEGVQQGLLKLLEGSVVNVPPNGGRKHPDAKMIPIDTKNILFICAGAFEGIEKRIASRYNQHTVGFGATIKRSSLNIEEDESLIAKVTPMDLRKFGLIPEIIGRLPVIGYTNPLTVDSLIKILTEPKNAIVKQYKKLLEMDGKTLVFEQDALKYIANKAYTNKTGARGLRGIMEEVMTHIMYEAPNSENPVITITKEYAKKQLNDNEENEELKNIA